MTRLAVLTGAILLALAPAARAADSSASIAAQLSRFALSEERYAQIVDATADSVAAQIAGSVQQNGGTVSADFTDRFKAEFRALIPYAELVDLQAGLLAKYYTADELKQLVAFYQSPLGQKALRIMPDLMKDVMGYMQTTFPKRIPALLERLKPYVNDPADNAAKAGAPAAPAKP
jgi:hypothetical protein